MMFLTRGEYDFDGLALLYKGITKRAMVWVFGSQSMFFCFVFFFSFITFLYNLETAFKPLSSEPFDQEKVQDANAAFKRLGEDSLFKDLKIEVNPEWLLGCNMSC